MNDFREGRYINNDKDEIELEEELFINKYYYVYYFVVVIY